MRHLATIQKIADVQPIAGADAIEKVQIKDWWCVAKKGEFAINDLCVYFEIDSLLPASNASFQFLGKGTKVKQMIIDGITYTGYRLKTIRLRGQVSQGLALPIGSVISNNNRAEGTVGFEIGDDVSESLGVVKYEAPIPAQLVGKIKGQFPSFLQKTDEERIQNIGPLIEKHRALGTVFYISEKLDGCSATFYKKDGVFGVCSRNLDLLETEGNTFWAMARKYDLENKLADGFAIQGEVMGEGIQGNPLKLKGHDFFMFSAFDITAQRYVNFVQLMKIAKELDVRTVPMASNGVTLTGDVQELLKAADGASALCSEAKREGLVFRPLEEMREVIGGQDARFSFKVISNEYLLSE